MVCDSASIDTLEVWIDLGQSYVFDWPKGSWAARCAAHPFTRRSVCLIELVVEHGMGSLMNWEPVYFNPENVFDVIYDVRPNNIGTREAVGRGGGWNGCDGEAISRARGICRPAGAWVFCVADSTNMSRPTALRFAEGETDGSVGERGNVEPLSGLNVGFGSILRRSASCVVATPGFE